MEWDDDFIEPNHAYKRQEQDEQEPPSKRLKQRMDTKDTQESATTCPVCHQDVSNMDEMVRRWTLFM
jgi:hypothetical protein